MAYDGSITLISGIKQANNGTFPLVDAPAVRVTDNKRLDEALDEKQNAPANAGTAGQVLGLDNNLAPVWIDQGGESVIDDTAGDGVTDRAWSANKIVDELATKADKDNPVFTGAISKGRKDGTVVGTGSTADGNGVTARGNYSRAEGNSTTASGQYAHSEGGYTTASGQQSHSEGYMTSAYGNNSHAEGVETDVSGTGSHVEGLKTTASGDYQHVSGKYNVSDASSAEIIGNGTGDNAKSNARRLEWNGNEYLKGDLYVQSDATGRFGKKVATETYVDNRISDVRVNGTSIMQNGIANVPIADNSNTLGVVKGSGYGVRINSSGELYISTGSVSNDIKNGSSNYLPIVPSNQHASAFYGLAKAAGDTSQASSSNAVGTYTDAAKIAIQKMLGIYEAPWELIREDTFTNETEADHVISVDGNGNAFELTDVTLLFETPKQNIEAKKGYYGQVQYKHDSDNVFVISSTTWTQAANSGPNGFYQFIERKNGLIFIAGTAANVSGSPTNLRYTPVEGFSNSSVYTSVLPEDTNKTVTQINIKAVTGTGHYKLYGKRKWN